MFVNEITLNFVVGSWYVLFGFDFVIDVGSALARVNSSIQRLVQRASSGKGVPLNPKIVVALNSKLHVILNRNF